MSETPAGHCVVPMTVKQREVLWLIVRYLDVTGETPPVAVLARKLGLNPSTVREHLTALHHKGWLSEPTPGGLYCPHLPPRK